MVVKSNIVDMGIARDKIGSVGPNSDQSPLTLQASQSVVSSIVCEKLS